MIFNKKIKIEDHYHCSDCGCSFEVWEKSSDDYDLEGALNQTHYIALGERTRCRYCYKRNLRNKLWEATYELSLFKKKYGGLEDEKE